MAEDPKDRGKIDNTRADLDRLLSRLSENRTRAWEEHEAIRRRLVKFFEFKQCSLGEELADETLARVAKKLATEEIQNVAAFAIGVARYVFLEKSKTSLLETSVEDIPGGQDGLVVSWDQELEILRGIDDQLRLACLRGCLALLKESDGMLAVAYYNAEQESQIEHRRKLAKNAGKKMGALMTYMNRLREKLELCVVHRLEERRRKLRNSWEREGRSPS